MLTNDENSNFEHGTWLFQLEKDNKKFNILGTNHIVPFSVLPKAIQEIVLNSDVLMGELDPNDELKNIFTSFPLWETNKEYNFNSLAPKLKNYITEIFAKNGAFGNMFLQEKIQSEHGMVDNALNINKFKLWFVCCLLFEATVHVNSEKTKNGMDTTISNTFNVNKKTVLGLENTGERILCSGLCDLSYEKSIEEIKKILESMHKRNDDEITKIYLNGSILEFRKFENSDENSFSVKRNFLWKPKIIKAHAESKSNLLVDVGLSHLLGKYGLLTMFAFDGFKIRRFDKDGNLTEFDPKIYFLTQNKKVSLKI